MMIIEQLGSKKDRLPSAERRKMVEKDYDKFRKTMNEFKQVPTKSASYFHKSREPSP